jgi:uncharacterized phage-associated protein
MDNGPVSVVDVAHYILRKAGPMTTMKLQKLVYYSQAWSLAWDGTPLFGDAIEAWEHGPVVRTLFEHHRGQRWIRDLDAGSDEALTGIQPDTIDAVLERYAGLSAEVLSELTHAEDPWRQARRQPDPRIIAPEALCTYYREVLANVLAEGEDAVDPDLAGRRFWLKSLLSQVTSGARPEEWDTGHPKGREVW